ncbi:uncharacterized protein IUM83_13282 [Phytophthora cinnamomi]|uniref:uncharacterized protein n=1 Tax=Phytophthora cinnamomi TaxID=4785 RepID=UPI00355A28A1|nr:hypothetical protein IUM83_13282 [Phytophthora cinnamomi]
MASRSLRLSCCGAASPSMSLAFMTLLAFFLALGFCVLAMAAKPAFFFSCCSAGPSALVEKPNSELVCTRSKATSGSPSSSELLSSSESSLPPSPSPSPPSRRALRFCSSCSSRSVISSSDVTNLRAVPFSRFLRPLPPAAPGLPPDLPVSRMLDDI